MLHVRNPKKVVNFFYSTSHVHVRRHQDMLNTFCSSPQVQLVSYARPTLCMKAPYPKRRRFNWLNGLTVYHGLLNGEIRQRWTVLLGCQYSYNLITKSSPISRDEYQRFFPWETTSNLITVYVTSAFLEWDSTLCLGNVEREMCFHSPCWITVSLAYLFIDLGAGFHTSQEGSISE